MKTHRILLLFVLIYTSTFVLRAQTNIGADDPNIQYVGRFDMTTPTAPGFDWSYSTIRAKFQGTSCSVKLGGSGKYFDVFIDGVKTGSITNASSGLQTFQVASGLSDTVHSISLHRRVEASQSGKNTFQGFVLDSGKTLVAPGPGPSRRIAFIGDSYTCGYGDEAAFGTPFTVATENACITYAAQMASHYNADCMITAWSGKGMVRNYGDANQTSPDPLPTVYARTCGSVAANDYDFAWQPDAVVIALGINDFSTTPYPSEAQYVTGYSNFVKTVRSHYPNADMLCTYLSSMNNIASNYIATVASTSGDSKVHFASVSYNLVYTNDLGSDWHPNASGQTKIANAFIPVFDSIMGTNWASSTNSGVAGPVNASDDQMIYSGRFDNGWGDSWSWMPRYATNNPVFTSNSVYVASNSMALLPGGNWQAWWLKAGTTVDTTIYTNLSFWINGGATGGQTISVLGELNNSSSGLPSVHVTAPANSWKQVVISLSSLGINNKSDLTGFQIGNQTSTNSFFIDDMRLVAAPAPATVHVNVNAGQTVRTVDGKVFGINQVAWDGSVNSPSTVSIVNNIGAPCLRWPGGSWGDGYHWTNENYNSGDTSPRYWGSFSPDFIQLATNTHCDAFIIVNYGTGTPEEAAYGVRMFNITNHCNFKYWEIGNEVGGFWEWDWNTNAPYKAHDPWTYAMRFKEYYTQMKAADPTIKIGAVADTTEDGTINNTDHPVINPRTGVTHNGWTPVMLTYMRSNHCIPDFLIEHNYGPTAGDTQDLLWSKVWATDAASLRQMLNDYLGDAATNVTLEITENGMGGDKQYVSLPGGLFYADSIGQVLQTEFNSRVWWDTRNGGGAITDPDPAFYGWRKDGSGNYISDGGIVSGSTYYPTYYAGKLLTHFARGGDTVVQASSDYELLATYAVKRTNGALTLLVINKSSSSNLVADFNVSGYLPYTNATVYSYGIPQDEAARTGIGSQDIQTNTASFQTSSLTFAPFSMSVVELSPADGPPTPPSNLAATGSSATVALTWSAAGGATSYIVKRSTTSGSGYVPVATDVTATSYVDTGLLNGTTYYYVVAATNSYGGSADSAEAAATPMIKLAGTVIGSPGSWGNSGNTITNVFDGNTNTFYDAVNGTNDWAGLDLGSGTNGVVMQIKYWPRAGLAYRMVGGQFQGANVADFSSGVVTLFTVGSAPPDGTMTVQAVANTNAFRYLCYIGPTNGWCNVAEVEFWGDYASSPVAAPTGVNAVAGDARVTLNWNAVGGATGYKVKRSPVSGGGYADIATNATLSYTNTGLANGTLYYFVVSALNAYGESTNSAEVSARSTASTPTPIGFAETGGQIQLNWPADHTGWQLQSQTNSLATGLGTNWVDVASSSGTNLATVPLSTTNGSVFFRLVRPY